MSKEESMKIALDDFEEVQEYMLSAREENAEKTYSKLKKKYLKLKALLNNLGTGFADIDIIKE